MNIKKETDYNKSIKKYKQKMDSTNLDMLYTYIEMGSMYSLVSLWCNSPQLTSRGICNHYKG